MRQKPHINTFKVGCDPEFAIIKSLDAPQTLIVAGAPITNGGQVGLDHGGTVVELRPDPSYLVENLMENLKDLLDSPLLGGYRQYVWRGGAFVPYNRSENNLGGVNNSGGAEASVRIGGHVHLELPYLGFGGIATNTFNARIKSCDRIISALETLGIHPKEECDKRRATGYGQFGAHQQANSADGGFIRTEYRTPCSWLFDPRVAYITLTGVKLAAATPSLTAKLFKSNMTKEKLFDNLVTFFRYFRFVDADAHYVGYKLFKNHKLSSLEPLVVNPAITDFKTAWEQWAEM